MRRIGDPVSNGDALDDKEEDETDSEDEHGDKGAYICAYRSSCASVAMALLRLVRLCFASASRSESSNGCVVPCVIQRAARFQICCGCGVTGHPRIPLPGQLASFRSTQVQQCFQE